MLKVLCLLCVLGIEGLCYSQIRDSSDLIFNDTVVNHYRINFYIPNWRDSLIFHKSNGEEYIPARFTWYNPAGDSIVLDSIGVRYKGNSSFSVSSEKKPFKLSFNKYRKKQLFFSLEKLNFSNCIDDPSMMREKLAYDILKKYMPSPRSSFATLTVEDSLVKCFYTQVEQVEEPFLKRHFNNDKGNLYKAGDQGVSLDLVSSNKDSLKTMYELKTNEKKDDWSGFISLLDKLKNTPDADFVKTVGGVLDLDMCIRYLAFNMINGNFDSYTGSGRNFYLYDDPGSGKFRWIPWDVNLAFGGYFYSWRSEMASVNIFQPSNISQRPLEKRILANDSLKRVYVNYIKNMVSGPLHEDSISTAAHRYASVIDSHVKADPKKFYTYEQFLRNIDSNVVIQTGPSRTILLGLKSYTSERNKNVLSQIENAMPIHENIFTKSRSSRTSFNVRNIPNGNKISIVYSLHSPEIHTVSINLFNAKGEKVHSLHEGPRTQGTYATSFTTKSIPAGYYLFVLNAGQIIMSEGLWFVK
ncbi:MAG TPA: CotH kinase family protein [Chitinispirillaceae bacterium]|nr:CotH kinase family protein [Chitinispirillaceae bacterium]